MKLTKKTFYIDSEVHDWAKMLARELGITTEDLYYITLKCSMFNITRIHPPKQVPVVVPINENMLKKIERMWSKNKINASSFFRSLFTNNKSDIVKYIEETNKYFGQ